MNLASGVAVLSGPRNNKLARVLDDGVEDYIAKCTVGSLVVDGFDCLWKQVVLPETVGKMVLELGCSHRLQRFDIIEVCGYLKVDVGEKGIVVIAFGGVEKA